MNNPVLLVGDDTFFHSYELDQNFETIQVIYIDEEMPLIDRFDFQPEPSKV